MSEAIKWETPATNTNEVFVKLKPLTDEQSSKGYYRELAEGQAIEGTYLGSRINDGKFGAKTEFLVKPFTGESVMVLTQAGNLGYRLQDKNIEVGDAVCIIYKGKNEMKTGKFKGTMAHNFQVLAEVDSAE